MKKLILIAMGLCLIAAPAVAFHDAGVAHCNGCHTMHNSQDGMPVDGDNLDGNAFLLKDGSPSDLCLNCHADGYGGVYSDPTGTFFKEQGGGNFWYLDEFNLNDGHAGASHAISGDAAGHNLVAPGRGLSADAAFVTSPGGLFPANQMGCSSCHDPHGTEAFRLLYGAGQSVQAGLAVFGADAPDAVGLGLFGGPENNANHTAYNDGMSDWCGNCHGDFHAAYQPGVKWVHPSGTVVSNAVITGNYNAYAGTTDLVTNGSTGGTGSHASAYLAAVPFEDPTQFTGSTAGMNSGSSKIMCLTCHRAHATSAPDAGRWDFNVTLLDDDGFESGSDPIPNPFDANQRSLCNKCHIKDAYDHITP